jgi:DMSO/TMAO reductase YedYZ molybdopterin-dependent catalytic subunit
MMQRRHFMATLGAGLVVPPALAETVKQPFGNGERPLVAYPQKRKLIRLTARPPQLETPMAAFDEALLTPNDAFFVRYHLADLPLDRIDPASYRLTVDGSVQRALSVSLAEIKAMGAQEITAVCQCSGNGRGFSAPRVPGGQAGNGLIGNARWQGVPLRKVLDRAGVQAGAVEVSFDGLDEPVIPATPDFVKSLPVDHARDGEVMLAWAMNGADLPFLNGYPLRLVVPGYFATYWVKHLSRITVRTTKLDNFWMAKAYRVPDTPCGCVPPGTQPTATRPIGRMPARSFITNIAEGATLHRGPTQVLRGVAFDSGAGIARVDVSADGGKTWVRAYLGEDAGRYAFRGWTVTVATEGVYRGFGGLLWLTRGSHVLLARATSKAGEVQPLVADWNPGGYQRHVAEPVNVTVS